MLKIGVALLSILAVPALAQSTVPSSTIKDALVKHWKTSGDFTIAVAKLMPADSYSFKPVPEELTFSQVVIQVAGANLNACANASGTKRPDIPKPIIDALNGKGEVDKDTIVQFLDARQKDRAKIVRKNRNYANPYSIDLSKFGLIP